MRNVSVFAFLVATAVAIPMPAYADSIVVTDVDYSGGVYQTCCGEPYISGINPLGVSGSGTTPFDITTSSTVCNGPFCEFSSITLSYLDGIASVSGSGSNAAGAFSSGGSGIIYVYFYVADPINEVVPLIFIGSGSTAISGIGGTPGDSRS